MKIILSSPIPGEIAQLKTMLESVGMACFTRNEISAGLSPEIPLSESTPELWIQDDDQLAKALEIKRAWKASVQAGGSNWTCSNCGESLEPQFSSCWQCGATRKDGAETCSYANVEIEQRQHTMAPEKNEATDDAGDKILCVSCGKAIKIGVKYCPFCDYTQPYEHLA